MKYIILLCWILFSIPKEAVAQNKWFNDTTTFKVGGTLSPYGYIFPDSIAKPKTAAPLFASVNVTNGKNSLSAFYSISRHGLGGFAAHEFKNFSAYAVGQKDFDKSGYLGGGLYTPTLSKNAVLFLEGGSIFDSDGDARFAVFFGVFIFYQKKVKEWHHF